MFIPFPFILHDFSDISINDSEIVSAAIYFGIGCILKCVPYLVLYSSLCFNITCINNILYSRNVKVYTLFFMSY